MRYLAAANSFENILGSNQSVSSTSFYSINNDHHLLHNGVCRSEISLSKTGLTSTQRESPHLHCNERSVRLQQRVSGLTPLFVATGTPNAFSHSNNSFTCASNTLPLRTHVEPERIFHPIVQVISSDSQARNNSEESTGNGVVLTGEVHEMIGALQRPKKWVRWSEKEDQYLRRAVGLVGENNFRIISERFFHGTRSEIQCKNRWKKVSGTDVSHGYLGLDYYSLI